jgi:hypothetical protein
MITQMVVLKWRHALDHTPRFTVVGPGTTLMVKDKVLWVNDSPTCNGFSTADEANAFASSLLNSINKCSGSNAVFDLDKLSYVTTYEAKNNELDARVAELTRRALGYDQSIADRKARLEQLEKQHTEMWLKFSDAEGKNAELSKKLEESEIRITAKRQRMRELDDEAQIIQQRIKATETWIKRNRVTLKRLKGKRK